MRRVFFFGFLLLCVHVYSMNAGFSAHYVQRRDIDFTRNYSSGIGTKATLSPTWYLSVGDTVEINCTAHNDKANNSDKIDLQLLWTKLGPGERTTTVLVSQRVSKGISYVLGPVTHEHQGVYTCDDDGTLPDVYVHAWHHFIWVDGESPRAHIDVFSHNRSQFFNGEIFTVSCQLPNDNTQWTMMRFDEWTGKITECPDQDSSGRSIFCTLQSGHPWSDVLFWCETPTGERSNALNITTTVVRVVLEAPTQPVMEGADVVLRCLQRNRNCPIINSNFRTVFYKNNRVMHISDGTMILKNVTKADEGLYKCRHNVEGASHDSWISVIARPDDDQKKSNTSTSL